MNGQTDQLTRKGTKSDSFPPSRDVRFCNKKAAKLF